MHASDGTLAASDEIHGKAIWGGGQGKARPSPYYGFNFGEKWSRAEVEVELRVWLKPAFHTIFSGGGGYYTGINQGGYASAQDTDSFDYVTL